MANILLLKRRIQTAQNVSKTTRAMQMIAASKLKKAQQAALMARPYVEKLTELSQNLASKVEKDNMHPYMVGNDSNKSLTLVISPDKGLCGSLNTNIAKEVLHVETKNESYIAFGKKMESSLNKWGKEITASFPFGNTLPSFDVVYPILQIIDDYFLNKKVSKVSIVYAKFESIFSQKAMVTNLLPIELPNIDKKSAEDMLFEPNVQNLLPSILRHFLEMTIYQNILETYASEQGAKMIAMKNATDNAKEMIEELKLEYNKGRQEKITNEILDIGGATFALNYEE
ncbi:MAG TPA: ATP synthase F1 subunit gamma [Patescibacteria group bacterium]|nr:ATP synthase F1 subunit gamma [Patescibacteria group bacterium]